MEPSLRPRRPPSSEGDPLPGLRSPAPRCRSEFSADTRRWPLIYRALPSWRRFRTPPSPSSGESPPRRPRSAPRRAIAALGAERPPNRDVSEDEHGVRGHRRHETDGLADAVGARATQPRMRQRCGAAPKRPPNASARSPLQAPPPRRARAKPPPAQSAPPHLRRTPPYESRMLTTHSSKVSAKTMLTTRKCFRYQAWISSLMPTHVMVAMVPMVAMTSSKPQSTQNEVL